MVQLGCNLEHVWYWCCWVVPPRLVRGVGDVDLFGPPGVERQLDRHVLPVPLVWSGCPAMFEHVLGHLSSGAICGLGIVVVVNVPNDFPPINLGMICLFPGGGGKVWVDPSSMDHVGGDVLPNLVVPLEHMFVCRAFASSLVVIDDLLGTRGKVSWPYCKLRGPLCPPRPTIWACGPSSIKPGPPFFALCAPEKWTKAIPLDVAILAQ